MTKEKEQGTRHMPAPVPPEAERRFLFLQGLASPFFKELGEYLRAQGHKTYKIDICLGDKVFWRGGDVRSYRGRFSRWPEYIRTFLKQEQITDVVLFGDCRPYHATAIDSAREANIRVHVFEEGYYRPNWVTLECGGVNARSGLPHDPDMIRALAAQLPLNSRAVRVTSRFECRAIWDIAVNVVNLFGIGLYPFYRHHRPLNPVLEYLAWIPRLLMRPWREKQAAEAIQHLASKASKRLFLLPLQLDSDYQIRHYSRFRTMMQVMEHVVSSFAEHAPGDAYLVVKVHPLDNGTVSHKRNLQKILRRYGVEGRVTCIDGGNLGQIILHVAGVVVVNSTVGLHALRDNRPVKVLGQAFYDIAGLTSQQSLDEFWHDPEGSDRKLYRNFHKVVMAQTQVNGGYYSCDAITVGVRNSAARLVAEPVRDI